jgi:hypothetical protein
VRLRIGIARPCGPGRQRSRFWSSGPSSAKHSAIRRRLTLTSSSWDALAAADLTTLSHMAAARWGENSSVSMARFTDMPRMASAIRRALRAVVRA